MLLVAILCAYSFLLTLLLLLKLAIVSIIGAINAGLAFLIIFVILVNKLAVAEHDFSVSDLALHTLTVLQSHLIECSFALIDLFLVSLFVDDALIARLGVFSELSVRIRKSPNVDTAGSAQFALSVLALLGALIANTAIGLENMQFLAASHIWVTFVGLHERLVLAEINFPLNLVVTALTQEIQRCFQDFLRLL